MHFFILLLSLCDVHVGMNDEHLVDMKSQMDTSDMVMDHHDDQQPVDENGDVNDDAPFNDDLEVESNFDSDDSRGKSIMKALHCIFTLHTMLLL